MLTSPFVEILLECHMADGEGQCCKELRERPRNLLSQYDIYVVYF